MDVRGDIDQSIPEIWFEPADPRRLAVLVSRMTIGILLSIAALSAVLLVTLNGRIAAGERFEDRQLAAGIAAADSSVRADLAAAAGREAMVVDRPLVAEASVEYPFTVLVAREVPDEARLAWLSNVATRTGGDDKWFSTNSDRGETWWHTTARISPNQVLVIHRPESRALATARTLQVWVAALGSLMALGLVGLRLILRSRVEASTNVLVEAVEDLRVRGEIRNSTRQRLETLPERPIELKRMARAVTEIEGEIRGALSEIDSLLKGAEALGSSLDPSDVLQASLNHLEELLGVERSAIVTFDHRRGTSEVVAVHGHDESFREALASRPYDRWMPSIQASRERQPVQISDTDSDFVADHLRKRARRFGYRSVMAVPLPPILSSPTVLILHKSEPYTYSHYEIELSVSFAAIAAAALRNAELFAQTDQSLREQTSRLSSIVESVDDGLLVEAVDGTVSYANSPLANLIAGDKLLGHLTAGTVATSELLGWISHAASDPERTLASLEQVRRREDAWCEVELSDDDQQRTWRVRSFTVRTAMEDVIGRGLVWTDVTRDRELDRMKTGLLATVSHEFRTPLALIKGYATTLLADDVHWEESDRNDFLRLMTEEADRLTTLVQRLLDMRRIEAGLVDLHTVPIELESLAESAIASVGPLAARIQVDPIPPLLIMADEARAVTAMRNLLDNACRYSPPDSTVTIEFEDRADGPAGPEVVVRILDRGRGVAPKDREAVFDMFVRGDSGLDAMHGGTGLGLAIAKGFVTAHGGRLWMEDRDGGGSVFAMSLPVATDVSTTGREPAVPR